MRIWVRRILALAFISLGLALVFLPFNNTQSGSVEQEVAYLQKVGLLNPELVKSKFPGEEIQEVSGPEFTEEKFPEIWWAVNNLDENWVTDTCSISEWNSFQTAFFNEVKEFRLIVFREALITCSTIETEENQPSVQFSYLGRYNTHIKELKESDLKKYPSILKAIKNVNFGKESERELTPIPNKEWYKMVDRYLNPMEDSQTFKFEGVFYGPEFAWDTIYKDGTIAGLHIILKIIGIILFACGILLLKRLYVRKRGIMINPARIALLYDFITLLFGVPSAYMLANVVMLKLFYVEPITSEEFILFQGAFFFVLGIPFVTLYTSRFTSQSVLINSKGIFVDSLLFTDFIDWESLKSIDFSNDYVLVSRVGMPIPKKLQQCLKLIGDNEKTILINEPQLKSVKRKIIAKLDEHTPASIKGVILEKLKNW